MTARQFNAWQAALGLTDSQAARQLGTSPSTIARYREQGGPAILALACYALASKARIPLLYRDWPGP